MFACLGDMENMGFCT